MRARECILIPHIRQERERERGRWFKAPPTCFYPGTTERRMELLPPVNDNHSWRGSGHLAVTGSTRQQTDHSPVSMAVRRVCKKPQKDADGMVFKCRNFMLLHFVVGAVKQASWPEPDMGNGVVLKGMSPMAYKETQRPEPVLNSGGFNTLWGVTIPTAFIKLSLPDSYEQK